MKILFSKLLRWFKDLFKYEKFEEKEIASSFVYIKD